MKEFAAFVKKEFRHILRDVRTIMIVLVMPVVQIVLFGFAISTEVNHVIVDVIGDMADPEVRRLTERIDNNAYLDVGEVLPSVNDVPSRFRAGKSVAAVCFSRHFGNDLGKLDRASVKIIGDGSDPNTAQMIVNYIKGVLNSEQADISGELTGGKQVDMSPDVQLMYNPGMKSAYNFVPGVMGLILMLICSMMTAISIVREKETGTMELLLVSPVRPMWIVVSKVIPYLVLSVINYISILLLSRYLMGVPLNGSLFLLSLVSVIFVIVSLSIGLLISSVSSSQQTALLISGMGMMMPTMLLSGIIFPCESMPVALQIVSDVIPAKWYIIMVRKIMIQGDGLGYMITEFSVLCGMMVFLVYASIRSFRTRM